MKITAFKMTELGPIPSDWEVKRLGEMLWFKNGFNANAKCYGTGTPVASVLDALSNEPITTETIATKVTADDKDRESFSLTKGDLIFTRSSETLEEVGRANVYFDDAPAMFGGFVIRGRFKIQANPIFVNYLLKTSDNRLRVMSQGAGAQHFNIGQSGLENVLIPLPPLPEQHRIAAALSDVDELIGALGKLVEKKRAIKTGAMQRLLTGQTRLPGFGGAELKQTELGPIPSDWEVKRLGDVCEIIMGQSPPSIYYNLRGDGIPLIQGNADLVNRKSVIRFYTSQITKTCDIGDVILSVRAPVGAVGKAGYVSCLGRGVCALKFKGDFLYQYLLFVEDKWGEFSKGSTFDSINSDELLAYKLLFPPLPEQRAIAEVLSDMDAEIAALEAENRKVEAIKHGMIQELMTGRVRLMQ